MGQNIVEDLTNGVRSCEGILVREITKDLGLTLKDRSITLTKDLEGLEKNFDDLTKEATNLSNDEDEELQVIR